MTTLLEWVENNPIDDAFYWKAAAMEQIEFVQHRLQNLLKEPVEVISTHRSKSISLPVYKLTTTPNLAIVLRNNFYDWKCSVISDRPLDVQLNGLFTPGASLHPVYFEGFPENLVFPEFSKENNKSWSMSSGTNYQVFAAVWAITQAYDKANT